MLQKYWSIGVVFVLACSGSDQSTEPNNDSPDAAPPPPEPVWLVEANIPGIGPIDTAVGLDDNIYLARSRNSNIWELDTITKSITQLETTDTNAHGSLYLVDGRLARWSSSVHLWLRTNEEWKGTFTSSQRSRPNAGTIWFQDRLFYVGGLTGNSGSPTKLVDQWRLVGADWINDDDIADLPWSVTLPHAITDSSNLWVMTHARVRGPQGMAMYVPEDNTWAEIELPEGLEAHSVAYLAGYVYVASSEGLFIMNAECNKWSEEDLDYADGMTQPPVLASNARGLFAIGGDPLRMFRVDGNSKTLQQRLPKCD